jgi:hypothetical protein
MPLCTVRSFGPAKPRGSPPASPFRRHVDAAARRLAPRCRGPPTPPVDRDDSDLRQSRRDRPSENCPTVAGDAAMLAEAVVTYVALRRAAGFAFKSEGSCLRSFARKCRRPAHFGSSPTIRNSARHSFGSASHKSRSTGTMAAAQILSTALPMRQKPFRSLPAEPPTSPQNRGSLSPPPPHCCCTVRWKDR